MAKADSTRGRPSGTHARSNRPRTHPRAGKESFRTPSSTARTVPPHLGDYHEALDHFDAAIATVEVVYRALEAVQSRVGLLIEDESLTIGAEILQLRNGIKALRMVYAQLDLMPTPAARAR